MAGVARSIVLQNFMTTKLKVNFFISLQVALLVLQVTLSAKKNSVNCVGTLSFRSGKESFGFKKLLELVWTLVYVFHQSIKWFQTSANFAIQKQVNKIRLLKFCL